MMCPQCELRPDVYEPNAWFQHVWFLYSLQQGGFPFGKDDLTIAEWLDIGELKKAVEDMKHRVK